MSASMYYYNIIIQTSCKFCQFWHAEVVISMEIYSTGSSFFILDIPVK